MLSLVISKRLAFGFSKFKWQIRAFKYIGGIRYNFWSKEEAEDFTHPLKQANYICNPRPKNLEGFKKQTVFRWKHLGMKELEIIIGDWIEMNADKMSYEELAQFEEEVIQVENPILFRYLWNNMELDDTNMVKGGKKHTESKYLIELKKYVKDRKENFAKYAQ